MVDQQTTGVAAASPAHAPALYIDALNLAYWCGEPPSLRMPMAVLAQRLAAAQPAVLYFDASARYRLGSEAGLYLRLLQHGGQVIEVPSGKVADGVMLRQATAHGACVLSKDRYRDHRRRYRRLIDDPARLLSGTVEGDRLFVPALALELLLPASVHEAWEKLEPLLAAAATAG